MKQRCAMQMFTLRDHTKTDPIGTLRKVADMGWDGAQISAMGGVPDAELAAALKDLQLPAVGEHVGLNQMLDNFQAVADRAHAIDCTWVFVPALPKERRGDRDTWMKTADTINDLARRFAKESLVVGYHNHAFEFEPVGDTCGMEIFLEQLDPSVVMEIDTYWVQFGGGDPVDYINRLKGRVPVLHLKDMAPGEERRFAEIGEGILDWPAILAASEAAGTEWLCVEQDNCYDRDPLDSAKISLTNLRTQFGR